MLKIFLALFAVLVAICSTSIVFGKSSSSVQKSKRADSGKPKSAVAVPRSKSKGTFSSLGQGFFGKLVQAGVRHSKIAFSSELESLILSLTWPTDSIVDLKKLSDLIACVDAEYTNPAWLAELLAKLSRKLLEPSIYTKIKVIISLHKLARNVEDKAKFEIMKAIRDMKKVDDEKKNKKYFDADLEECSTSVANVGERKALNLMEEYEEYVYDFIDARGDKYKIRGGDVDRANLLLDILEAGVSLEDLCTDSEGFVNQLCLEGVKEDREWILKQLNRLYDAGLEDEELETEVLEKLKEANIKVKPLAKSIPIVQPTETKKVVVPKPLPTSGSSDDTTPIATTPIPTSSGETAPSEKVPVASKVASGASPSKKGKAVSSSSKKNSTDKKSSSKKSSTTSAPKKGKPKSKD